MACNPEFPDSQLYLQDALNALASAFGPGGGAATALNQVTGNLLLAQISGDTSSIDAKLTNPLPVSISGLPSFDATQVAVGVAEVAIPTANLALRKTISVKALAANVAAVYIGETGVTASTGYELSAGDSVEIDVDATVFLFAIAASGTQRVSLMEVA